MQYVMVTGSNRGIGFGLVKEYLERGAHVFAACRQPDSASDLKDLQDKYPENLTIVALDINDNEAIASARQTVGEKTSHLDLLINNAGVFPRDPENTNFGDLERESLNYVVSTNSTSPVIVTQAFADLLKAGNTPRVVMISSQMGSITRASASGFSYRVSKAALNMATKVLSQMLRDDGITIITTHPGHVETDMGGAGAALKPAQSAAGLAQVAESLTPAQSGKFYDYSGNELPW